MHSKFETTKKLFKEGLTFLVILGLCRLPEFASRELTNCLLRYILRSECNFGYFAVISENLVILKSVNLKILL